ncbi:MAG: cob(I)yrinic acid a,c-diamide adenosyltransferase [Verrucomicrobiota bacterium]|jgi:cob(I)alamin adenosyltransferase
MSIVTRTGDRGTTGLMYNRRVSKHHPRVEAYGSVDELNAALGLARAVARGRTLRRQLLDIQQDLVTVMGELATEAADRSRYVKDGFRLVTPELAAKLDRLAADLEARHTFSGWVMPGETRAGAALDLARTVCRRAERRVCALHELGELGNDEIIVFLNRLADVLWLLARQADAPKRAKPLPPRRKNKR